MSCRGPQNIGCKFETLPFREPTLLWLVRWPSLRLVYRL